MIVARIAISRCALLVRDNRGLFGYPASASSVPRHLVHSVEQLIG